MAFLSGYTYRKKLTVQTAYLDASLTDFPGYVLINADTDIGGRCRADGHDIRFTQNDGTTLLNYDRRSFVITAGAATGRFIIKTNLATSPATDIYIYYGKADASDGADAPNAYDSYFKGIWPCTDLTLSTIADSLGINPGTKKAANEPLEEAGPIYKAQHFDGSDDFISTPLSMNGAAAITLEAWINLDVLTQVQRFLSPLAWNNDFFTIRFTTSNTMNASLRWFTANSFNAYSLAEVSAGLWYYVAGVADIPNQKLYLYQNGILQQAVNIDSSGIFNNNNIWQIGQGSSFQRLDGLEAEARISNIARSAAWIKFTYYNITEADHEWTWGTEEITYTLAGLIAGQSILGGNLKMAARLAGAIVGKSYFTGNITLGKIIHAAGSVLGITKGRESRPPRGLERSAGKGMGRDI